LKKPKPANLREQLADTLRKLGTPIDWVDVGFAVIESAALQGADEAEAYRTVEQLLREGYIKAVNLMEGPPAI
jgi:aryl-alcohol dehydrogenase-like predicted oxidoreductase